MKSVYFPKISLVCMLLCIALISSACASLKLGEGPTGVQVRIKSVPLKIVIAASGSAIQVAAEEYLGLQIDVNDLLRQVAGVEVSTGVPPTDIPVLMVVNKQSNDILYWKLTENVKMLRLKHNSPGKIELKVINEEPLRIELWIDGDTKEIEVTVELNG